MILIMIFIKREKKNWMEVEKKLWGSLIIYDCMLLWTKQKWKITLSFKEYTWKDFLLKETRCKFYCGCNSKELLTQKISKSELKQCVKLKFNKILS